MIKMGKEVSKICLKISPNITPTKEIACPHVESLGIVVVSLL